MHDQEWCMKLLRILHSDAASVLCFGNGVIRAPSSILFRSDVVQPGRLQRPWGSLVSADTTTFLFSL